MSTAGQRQLYDRGTWYRFKAGVSKALHCSDQHCPDIDSIVRCRYNCLYDVMHCKLHFIVKIIPCMPLQHKFSYNPFCYFTEQPIVLKRSFNLIFLWEFDFYQCGWAQSLNQKRQSGFSQISLSDISYVTQNEDPTRGRNDRVEIIESCARHAALLCASSRGI